MRMLIQFSFIFTLALYVSGGPLNAKETKSPDSSIEVSALLQSLVYWKNDSDFDRTLPKYDAEGQSVGLAATIFQPMFKLRKNDVSIVSEMEVGLNNWSKNNPDQAFANEDDRFIYSFRQLFIEADLNEKLAVKAGYQNYMDPSGLFINHWLGAASVFYKSGSTSFRVSAGQIPDGTYEGFSFEENNFAHDVYFGGISAITKYSERYSLQSSLYFLDDQQVVGKRMTLLVPGLSVKFQTDRYKADFDAVLQLGQSDFGVMSDEKVKHFAFALQNHSVRKFDDWTLFVNTLYLSADDDDQNNNFNGAFFSSGKNKSATVIMTEDELSDKGLNLDEKASKLNNGFFTNRAGLLLGDLKVEFDHGESFKPSVTVGTGLVANSNNSLGGSYFGSEINLDLAYFHKDTLDFHFVVASFLPGPAGAALVNDISRTEQERVYSVQTLLNARF